MLTAIAISNQTCYFLGSVKSVWLEFYPITGDEKVSYEDKYFGDKKISELIGPNGCTIIPTYTDGLLTKIRNL